MMQKRWSFSVIVGVAIVGIITLFLNISNTQVTPSAGPYLVTAPYMPSTFTFAGENVPLTDPEVYERLDRELISNVYFHSQTILNLKKAHKYFGVIEQILKKEGVPEDFKYLCVIESNLSNVVSPAGAAGFWQFLASTGKGYGLEINNEVDERYNLEKSTKAACAYLKEAHERFGNWTNAAASYNMGQAGISTKQATQKESNYYDLLLYEETQRYLFRILAVKSIFENPDRYGFYILPQEKYNMPPYTIKTVNTKITSLVDFAKENGVTYKDLKSLNPWLRSDALRNANGKSYDLLILKK